MPELACVNGIFSSMEEARVSINDRGLVFGDSVYEVLHVHRGRLWAAEQHYRRLARSLKAIGLEIDLAQVRAWVEEALRRSGLEEALVYLQVTAGAAPRDHVRPSGLVPTVIVTVRHLLPMLEEMRLQGVKAITVAEHRWRRRDIKSTNLLPNVLAKEQAQQVGAYEAILVEADGTVTEGASTNVFLVHQGQLHTPPRSHSILPGITRELLIETARELGYAVHERRISLGELYQAEELFLSGTTTEALGVVELDGFPIGSGRVGPITLRLYEAYWERIRQGRD